MMDRLELSESPARVAVAVSGIVQGVGFRPFVYRLATRERLAGFVRNDGRGVYIEVQGHPVVLERFLLRIRSESPPAAAVLSVEAGEIPPREGTSFTIEESGKCEGRPTPVTPDLATCGECLAEVLDPGARRCGYAFTNCTNCGPRFTIVESVPYDRPGTTMKKFDMCEECGREYLDPGDRRFHAQPVACPKCGPQLKLVLKLEGGCASRPKPPPSHMTESPLKGPAALDAASELLGRGMILGIKGIGGFHLACDARSETAVTRLRAAKHRYDRPFAIMVRDVEAAIGLCHVGDAERRTLESAAAPVVLLARRENAGSVATAVAPGLPRLGVMLPYTPLHHLLLRDGPDVLVMTSGNVSEEPIAYEDDEAIARLGKLIDALLTHDRPIGTRCDDSVTWVPKVGRPQIVRRSRGYSPSPLALPAASPYQLLAVGGHFKNTFCLARGDVAYLSHHIGDMSTPRAFDAFTDGVEHYKELFAIEPEVVALDMHPDYLTSKYAAGVARKLAVEVQHHHAHVASCMAENGVESGRRVLGVAFDGTGYGPDGTIWGGEFLICTYEGFRRYAHLGYMPLPGGEAAVWEPWRLGAFAAETVLGPEFQKRQLPLNRFLDAGKWKVLRQALQSGVNAPLCCSAGRLFDCVAAVLGLRGAVNYEGQAAVELEAAALACRESEDGAYDMEFQEDTVSWEPIMRGVLDDAARGETPGIVAAKFHRTLAEVVLEISKRARCDAGIDAVALTGGVFVNTMLHHMCAERLLREGFAVYLHSAVPPNDGGIAYGQAVVAAARLAGGSVRPAADTSRGEG